MNSYIGGSHNELTIAPLKLYNAMSSFKALSWKDLGGILRSFFFPLVPSLPFDWHLVARLYQSYWTYDVNCLEVWSNPTLFCVQEGLAHTLSCIQSSYFYAYRYSDSFHSFLLSFLNADATTQSKNPFLEQHRDTFLSIFRGMVQDHYAVARMVLEACWTGIWSNNKVKRTLKIGLFNENTVGHVSLLSISHSYWLQREQPVKLYDHVQSTDGDPNADHIPADLVHQFLPAICTRPSTGICFKDRG